MKKQVKIGLMTIVGCVIFYGLVYLCFRQTHIEVWKNTGDSYVIFPKNAPVIYLILRPAAYADGLLTGMKFHIGPHQD